MWSRCCRWPRRISRSVRAPAATLALANCVVDSLLRDIDGLHSWLVDCCLRPRCARGVSTQSWRTVSSIYSLTPPHGLGKQVLRLLQCLRRLLQCLQTFRIERKPSVNASGLRPSPLQDRCLHPRSDLAVWLIGHSAHTSYSNASYETWLSDRLVDILMWEGARLGGPRGYAG